MFKARYHSKVMKGQEVYQIRSCSWIFQVGSLAGEECGEPILEGDYCRVCAVLADIELSRIALLEEEKIDIPCCGRDGDVDCVRVAINNIFCEECSNKWDSVSWEKGEKILTPCSSHGLSTSEHVPVPS